MPTCAQAARLYHSLYLNSSMGIWLAGPSAQCRGFSFQRIELWLPLPNTSPNLDVLPVLFVRHL